MNEVTQASIHSQLNNRLQALRAAVYRNALIARFKNYIGKHPQETHTTLYNLAHPAGENRTNLMRQAGIRALGEGEGDTTTAGSNTVTTGLNAEGVFGRFFTNADGVTQFSAGYGPRNSVKTQRDATLAKVIGRTDTDIARNTASLQFETVVEYLIKNNKFDDFESATTALQSKVDAADKTPGGAKAFLQARFDEVDPATKESAARNWAHQILMTEQKRIADEGVDTQIRLEESKTRQVYEKNLKRAQMLADKRPDSEKQRLAAIVADNAQRLSEAQAPFVAARKAYVAESQHIELLKRGEEITKIKTKYLAEKNAKRADEKDDADSETAKAYDLVFNENGTIKTGIRYLMPLTQTQIAERGEEKVKLKAAMDLLKKKRDDVLAENNKNLRDFAKDETKAARASAAQVGRSNIENFDAFIINGGRNFFARFNNFVNKAPRKSATRSGYNFLRNFWRATERLVTRNIPEDINLGVAGQKYTKEPPTQKFFDAVQALINKDVKDRANKADSAVLNQHYEDMKSLIAPMLTPKISKGKVTSGEDIFMSYKELSDFMYSFKMLRESRAMAASLNAYKEKQYAGRIGNVVKQNMARYFYGM